MKLNFEIEEGLRKKMDEYRAKVLAETGEYPSLAEVARQGIELVCEWHGGREDKASKRGKAKEKVAPVADVVPVAVTEDGEGLSAEERAAILKAEQEEAKKAKKAAAMAVAPVKTASVLSSGVRNPQVTSLSREGAEPV